MCRRRLNKGEPEQGTEWRDYRRQVTEFELRRYLPVLGQYRAVGQAWP
ncbi:hypothetical protein ACFXJ8_04460 [Nonomuraea sp. NPDC059194]